MPEKFIKHYYICYWYGKHCKKNIVDDNSVANRSSNATMRGDFDIQVVMHCSSPDLSGSVPLDLFIYLF